MTMIRLTMAQALTRYLAVQTSEVDGREVERADARREDEAILRIGRGEDRVDIDMGIRKRI